MTFLLFLLAIAVLMGTDTVRRMWRDGGGPTSPPASHFEDPQFLSPTHR